MARVILRGIQTERLSLVLPVVSLLSVESIFIRPQGHQAIEAANKSRKRLESVARDDFSLLLFLWESYQVR